MSRVNCHPEPCENCRARPAEVWTPDRDYVCRGCRAVWPWEDPDDEENPDV